eukprot:scaffold215_cov423-Prasinococcus_capsulatus_cf.AAC.8
MDSKGNSVVTLEPSGISTGIRKIGTRCKVSGMSLQAVMPCTDHKNCTSAPYRSYPVHPDGCHIPASGAHMWMKWYSLATTLRSMLAARACSSPVPPASRRSSLARTDL